MMPDMEVGEETSAVLSVVVCMPVGGWKTSVVHNTLPWKNYASSPDISGS